ALFPAETCGVDSSPDMLGAPTLDFSFRLPTTSRAIPKIAIALETRYMILLLPSIAAGLGTKRLLGGHDVALPVPNQIPSDASENYHSNRNKLCFTQTNKNPSVDAQKLDCKANHTGQD